MRNFMYDVAFSFAEENHDFVDEVVGHLRFCNLNYYYYKEDLVTIWGKDLKKHLSGIYKRQSRLCVIFVSEHYKEKVWTKFEIANARIRAKKDIQEYVLPFKLDDTELPEISPSIKYLSIHDLGAKELADAICRKINDHKRKDTFIHWLYGRTRNFFFSRRNSILTAVFTFSLITLLLRDHLTSVDNLTVRLYERSKKKIKGSLCRDGSFSRSRGSGTCSYHSGVLIIKDSMLSDKTIDECREAAKEISWIP